MLFPVQAVREPVEVHVGGPRHGGVVGEVGGPVRVGDGAHGWPLPLGTQKWPWAKRSRPARGGRESVDDPCIAGGLPQVT